MPEQDDKIHRIYKYRITEFKLISQELEEPVDLVPARIMAVQLTCDWDNNIYPLFSITMMISPKIKEFISFRRDEVKFHIKLVELEYDIDRSATEPQSVTEIFDKIFIPNIAEPIPFMDVALYEESINALKQRSTVQGPNDLGDNNYAADNTEMVTYYFYDEHDLNDSKKVVNEVYASANIPTTVADLATRCGFNKILMSPIEKTEEIPQLVIPPQNFINIFDYLTEIYGMYPTGVTTFFDYRCLYVLNKSGHPNALEKGEFKTTIFLVKKSNDSANGMAGTILSNEKKEYYFYPDPRKMEMQNPSTQNDHIYGNNLTYIASQANSHSNVKGAGAQRGDGISRVESNPNANEFTKSQYANTVSENNVKMRIPLFDVKMDALTPNKEFLVQWEDSTVDGTYVGLYRPTKVEYVFNKDGDNLCITAMLNMVKKEDISEVVAGAQEVAINEDTAQYIGQLQGAITGPNLSGFDNRDSSMNVDHTQRVAIQTVFTQLGLGNLSQLNLNSVLSSIKFPKLPGISGSGGLSGIASKLGIK